MNIKPITVTPREASRLIGLSRSTIYEMLKSGELTRIKCGRSTLIEVAELEAWVEAKKRESA